MRHFSLCVPTCHSNGSSSFLPEIGDARVTIHFAWDRRCANPTGGEVPRLLTPWANQMTYHAAHTPRSGRTQDCGQIWRHFGTSRLGWTVIESSVHFMRHFFLCVPTCHSNGSPSFSPEIGNARVTILLAWDRRCANPTGGELPRLFNSMG